MPIRDIDQLNEMHIDVLREIGNIGAGNAATSLASMLDRRVNKTTPMVRILEVNDAISMLGGPENVVIAILAKLYGDLDGIMMFIIKQDFAQTVLQTLLGHEVSCDHLSEMDLSAISEVGNIMVAAYTGAIGSLSQLNIKSSVPAITVDMVGAVMNVPATEMPSVSEHVIFIEDDFLGDDDKMTANTLFVPTLDSLNKLLQQLGIVL